MESNLERHANNNYIFTVHAWSWYIFICMINSSIHPKLVSGMVKHVYGDDVQYMTLIFVIVGMQICNTLTMHAYLYYQSVIIKPC